MKLSSQSKAITRLSALRDAFRDEITHTYEHRAKSCVTCETPGACCLDEHFVNVHISRLEAVAIKGVLNNLAPEAAGRIKARIEQSIKKYALTEEGDTYSQTYACPLFEPGSGCLVHTEAKPFPCIQHACYESEADLPPDDVLTAGEEVIDEINYRTYGTRRPLLPIPIAIRQVS